MIKAEDAKANVINYKAKVDSEIANKVMEVLNVISDSIEFHSKSGLSSAIFYPYDKSRFTTIHAMEYAQDLFAKLLEENGYTILQNEYAKNILSIQW